VANYLRKFKESVSGFREGIVTPDIMDITSETELMIELDGSVLPVSFIAAIFAIDTNGFPRDQDDKIPFGYLLTYICKIKS
ncbi:hypothetical protein ACHAQH_008511, partial [Verticillium albo-atrum]